MAEIEIKKDLSERNGDIAARNRERFKENGVYVINIMGSPGSGKTTLLEYILPALSKEYETAVIEGDLETENDAERIRKTGVSALQINTGGGCHLDASMIEREYKRLGADKTELLIIENVGNLVCPISFDLGEDLRIVVLSVPEGEDKPLKYPPAMLKTDAVVITKTDLAAYVDADVESMKRNVLKINPKADIIEVGKVDGIYNAKGVTDYINEKYREKKA